jgi:hypothetical protein
VKFLAITLMVHAPHPITGVRWPAAAAEHPVTAAADQLRSSASAPGTPAWATSPPPGRS